MLKPRSAFLGQCLDLLPGPDFHEDLHLDSVLPAVDLPKDSNRNMGHSCCCCWLWHRNCSQLHLPLSASGVLLGHFNARRLVLGPRDCLVYQRGSQHHHRYCDCDLANARDQKPRSTEAPKVGSHGALCSWRVCLHHEHCTASVTCEHFQVERHHVGQY